MNPGDVQEEKVQVGATLRFVRVRLGEDSAVAVNVDDLKFFASFCIRCDGNGVSLPALPSYYGVRCRSEHVRLLVETLSHHGFDNVAYKLEDIEAVFSLCDYFMCDWSDVLGRYFESWIAIRPCLTLKERLQWANSSVGIIKKHFEKVNKMLGGVVSDFFDDFKSLTDDQVLNLMEYQVDESTKPLILERLLKIDASLVNNHGVKYSLKGGCHPFVGMKSDNHLKLSLCALDSVDGWMDDYERCRRIMGLWMGVDTVGRLSPLFVKHLVAVNNLFVEVGVYSRISLSNDLCIVISTIWEDIEKSLLKDGIDDKHRGIYGWNLESFCAGRLRLLIKVADCRNSLENGDHFKNVMRELNEYKRHQIAGIIFGNSKCFISKTLKFYASDEAPDIMIDNIVSKEESVAGFADGFVKNLNNWFNHVFHCVIVCNDDFIGSKDRLLQWLAVLVQRDMFMSEASKQWESIFSKIQDKTGNFAHFNEVPSEYTDGDEIPYETDSEVYDADKYTVMFEECQEKFVLKGDTMPEELVEKWKSLSTQHAFNIGMGVLSIITQEAKHNGWKCNNIYLKFVRDVVGVDWCDDEAYI